MRKRLSLMLALLLIAATGAWAAAVAGETITLKCGSTVKTYENVTLPWSTTAEILKQVISDMNFMPPSIGTITEGDGKVVKNGNENFQVTGTFSGEATVAVTYYNSSMTSSTATITVTAPGAAGTSGSGDVKMAEGTEDAENWTLSDGTNTAKGNVGLTGVPENTKVTATYGGTKKVKSVKAVKKGGAEPVDNTYQKWDADQKKLVKTDIQAEVTMVANADTDVNWEAGTYVVEGDVTIGGTITLLGNVDLIIKDGAKLTVNSYIYGYSSKNLSIFGQSNQTGELVVNSSFDVIEDINTLEVHSAKVKATASGDNCSGFLNIRKFNVYGGSVDAENTGSSGGYGITLAASGSMNIYGGDVKALGKGNKFGIMGNHTTVTVYGGKLWAGCANNKAIDASNVTLEKGAGFTGKIEVSGNGESWTNWEPPSTPGTNYVRVGY